jgi:hypothetical protein
MSNQLFFASTQEAIQYLSDISESRVIISKCKTASDLPKENIDKFLFYLDTAINAAKKVPVSLAYAIGFFQKHPELMNDINIDRCIKAEELSVKLYEVLNKAVAQASEARGQIRYDYR